MSHSATQAAPRAIRARGRLGLAGLLVLLLATAGVGGLLLWRGLHPDPPPAAPLPAYPFDRRAAATSGATPAAGSVSVPAYGPARLGIPSLRIDAPVVPEPATTRGDLVIPGDPGTVGRWRGGADLAATVGTTLLAGHVNVAGEGLGALSELHRVEPGALVVTTDAGGAARYWRVEALLVRAKNDLPPFPQDGPRQLAIVTCGGPLEHAPGGNTYRDNVIALAAPATGPVP